MPAERPLRICHIALKGMPLGGGIEKYTEQVGSRLAARGHEITVYAMRHYGARDGVYRGMHIRTVPTIRSRSLEKFAAYLLATAYESTLGSCDVIHMHSFGPAMLSILPRLTGQTVLVQGHGLEWKRSRWSPLAGGMLRAMEPPSVRFPHAVAVVSRTLQRYVRETYGRECFYLPTGVEEPQPADAEPLRPLGLEAGNYVLFLSRLVREKNAHLLIRAFRRLRTDARLVIAGDAQHEQRYKEQLGELARGDRRILFPGFVTGLLWRSLLSNARLYVQPSGVEGLSLSLLEAMSYGNCCLVSDIPENLEAIHGHGFSFRHDDEANLAAKMNELLRDDSLRASAGAAGRAFVLAHHSWDDIAARTESVYAGLLGR